MIGMYLPSPTGISVSSREALFAAVFVVLAGAAIYLSLGTGQVTGMAVALTGNQSNVTVSVAETTSVTLTPDSYNFSGVTVGSTNFSDNPALNLIIENSGSTNITNIYAHPNTLESEQDNPLGTGLPGEYAAGRFLWMQNGTSDMYHVGYLSWNITQDAGGKPTGLNTGFTGPGEESWGFYRNHTGDYIWAMNSSTNGYCNESDVTLRMKNETDSGAGSNRDLSIQSERVDYDMGADGTEGSEWAMLNSPATEGPLKGHYVATHQSCEKFYVFRFDSEGIFPVTGNDPQYIYSGNLVPGESFSGDVGLSMPEGIPAGDLNSTILTIYASPS